MKEIIVVCGTDRASRQFPTDATVGDVVNDHNIRAILGYGDNVRALVGGVEIDFSTDAPAGATIRVETKANTKNN
jgi:hypothetical protein